MQTGVYPQIRNSYYDILRLLILGHLVPAPQFINDFVEHGLLTRTASSNSPERLMGFFPLPVLSTPGYMPWVLHRVSNHIYANVFPEWQVISENNTYRAGWLSHVGQFFDDELCLVVDETFPYVSNPISIRNTVGRTPNTHGSLSIR